MGRKHKKQHPQRHSTGNTKHHSRHSHTIRLDITPEQLFENGDLQGAVDLLQPYIKEHPTDNEKRRLLGSCLFNLGQYPQAIEVLLLLEEKNWADLFNIGAAYFNVEDWGNAIKWLEESLQAEEFARTCFILALAYKRTFVKDDDDFSTPPIEIPLETQQRIVDLLQQARSLPDCPVSVYYHIKDELRELTHRKRFSDPQERKREYESLKQQCSEIAEEAFKSFPEESQIRLEYVEDLLDQGKYETALLILSPFAAHDSSSKEAKWTEYEYQRALMLTVRATISAKLYERAIAALDKLLAQGTGDYYNHPNPLKLKGDLLFAQKAFENAQKCYEDLIQSTPLKDQFLGLLSLAWLVFQQGQVHQSCSYAKQAADRWFECGDEVERLYAVDCIYSSLEDLSVGFRPTDCIERVCIALLKDVPSLEPSLKGQLSYLLYKYRKGFYRHSEQDLDGDAEVDQLLQEALHNFKHPLMYTDVAIFHLEQRNLPLAIDYHLSAYQYLASLEDWEDFTAFYEAIEVETKEERKAIHAVAWQKLKECTDTLVIQKVFRPFFEEFWETLLKDGNMHQECVEVMRALVEASDDVDDLWFNYAFGLDEAGETEKAEQIYRKYLEYYPDDTDTLHNLSLLVAAKGFVLEALMLSNKAVALDPTNETFAKHNQDVKNAYDEQGRARAQARMNQWSLFTPSQKQLLCLLELYPVTHWSELHPHIKKDEQYLRQLQEDWEYLDKQNAFIQQSEEDPSIHAISLLEPLVQDEGFRHWLSTEIAAVQNRKKKDLWLPGAPDLDDAHLPHLTAQQRDLLHKALLRRIDRISSLGLEHLLLFFYRRIWKELLLQWKMYVELVELYEIFLARLPGMQRQDLWDCAFYAAHLTPSSKYQAIAEKRYKAYLEQGEDRAAYHNLALIYFRGEQYEDGLQMIEHALQLEPSNAGSLKLKESIEQAIKKEEEQRQQREREQQRQQEERERYLKSLEPNILAHIQAVDYYKLKILQALHTSRYFSSKRALARDLRMEDWAFEGHWKKLVAWNLIIEEHRSIELHPLIIDRLNQGWALAPGSSMKTLIITPGADSLTKPVFNSQQEYKLYRILLEMFPGVLVFPNMSLQTIFPWKKMEAILTPEEFNYYKLSSVDICLTRTTSYYPLIAFEVDGPHHEGEYRTKKDALKNSIFEKGGLGLIRLQIGDQPLSPQVMWEDVRTKINQALYTWQTDAVKKRWAADIETELGVSPLRNEETQHTQSGLAPLEKIENDTSIEK